MPINNNIIIRLIFSFLFFAITLRVLIPLLFDFIKKKLPGNYSHDSDIDQMIRRQKERLRAAHGLTSTVTKDHQSKEIQKISQQTKWGGGSYAKDIQQEIARNYAYSLTESKVNAFIFLCEKKNYFDFLDSSLKNSDLSIKNYLSTFLLYFLLSEELRGKSFFITAKIAAKIAIPTEEFALAIQLKILLTVSLKKELKENRIFTDKIEISQYSEETIREAIESIAQKEANLWARGPSLFFEELTLSLNYAHLLSALPQIKNKNDLSTAYSILKTNPEQSTENIKAIYKKLALQKHPDKIVSQKLPKYLEKIAILKWGKIQEAYEIIMANRK